MKYSILTATISLLLFSCNTSNENNQKVQMIDPNNVQLNEVVHDSLTIEQIDKIKRVHKVFEEVYPVSLEETITNFKRDRNPDNEITIWMNMADAFEKYLNSKKNIPDLDTQNEVFALLLSRSMMSNEEAIVNAKLKVLSEKEAHEVLNYYTENPVPLTVETK